MTSSSSSTTHDANEYAEPQGPALAAYSRRHLALVASEDLPTARRLVAEKIIHLSFDAGRSVSAARRCRCRKVLDAALNVLANGRHHPGDWRGTQLLLQGELTISEASEASRSNDHLPFLLQ